MRYRIENRPRRERGKPQFSMLVNACGKPHMVCGMNVIQDLYKIVLERKQVKEEGSYTCYLFEKGIDKILKKCGEESAEMIIAAKNADNDELKNEIADLVYHVLVLCAESGLEWGEVEQVLRERRDKIGNLKQIRETDRLT